MRDRKHEAGQALFEFGVTLPILMALVLGVIEFGYTLFQIQLVTSMAREGSNLIARQVTINDAEAALQTMMPGESVYVTEVFTQRTSIVPFLPLPATLRASAYF